VDARHIELRSTIYAHNILDNIVDCIENFQAETKMWNILSSRQDWNTVDARQDRKWDTAAAETLVKYYKNESTEPISTLHSSACEFFHTTKATVDSKIQQSINIWSKYLISVWQTPTQTTDW